MQNELQGKKLSREDLIKLISEKKTNFTGVILVGSFDNIDFMKLLEKIYDEEEDEYLEPFFTNKVPYPILIFHNSNLTEASFKGTKFFNFDFRGSDFRGSVLKGTDFDNSDIRRTSFYKESFNIAYTSGARTEKIELSESPVSYNSDKPTVDDTKQDQTNTKEISSNIDDTHQKKLETKQCLHIYQHRR